jgi:hypothetical protein
MLKRRWIKMDEVYVVEYDIPDIPRIRMRFYREIRRFLNNGEKLAKYSTQSVIITEDEVLAKSIYMLASKYGKARLYKAYPIEYSIAPELVTPVTSLIKGGRD